MLTHRLPCDWFYQLVYSDSRAPIPCRAPCSSSCQSLCSLDPCCLPSRLRVHRLLFWENPIHWFIGKTLLQHWIPSDVASLRSKPIAIVHDSLWLIIDNFAVVVALPSAIVFFKGRAPEIRIRILFIVWHSKNLLKDYLLQGKTQMPQHFSMPLKFFSASRMSALIWSMPSSIRSSCSVRWHQFIN